MVRGPGLVVVVGILLASAQVAAIAGMDPDSLRLVRTSGEVRLTWSGDESMYLVYRGDGPDGVEAPVNQISRTGASLYDDPLPGIPCESCFYLVVPDGGFACGELACSIATEYCFVLFPGVPGAPPQHECAGIPAECLPRPTCRCVQGEMGDRWPPSASECSQSAEGAITIGVFAP